MSYIKYLAYVALILSAQSCSKHSKQKGSFTSDELSWLVYKNGDTIKFTKETGVNEQYFVDSRNDFTQLKRYYPIEAEVDILPLQTSEHKFSIYLLKDHNYFKKYLRIDDVYKSLDLATPETVTVKGKKFENVYVIEQDTIEHYFIRKILYSPSIGILSYTNYNDETFYAESVL